MIRLLVTFLEAVLNIFYRDRIYPRFFILETVARVPYFSCISVLHLYESMGWWRKADWLKVHFAQSWNELHHLLIAESLGGNRYWIDRFAARIGALGYYWILVAVYLFNPRAVYRFMQLVEEHAYHTYARFLKEHSEDLKSKPAPQVAINYYLKGDLYLFDEFQTSRVPHERRPKIDNLYDVYVAIRDDELEHVKTMVAFQSPDAQQNCISPHSIEHLGLPESTKVVIEAATKALTQDALKEPVEMS